MPRMDRRYKNIVLQSNPQLDLGYQGIRGETAAYMGDVIGSSFILLLLREASSL